MADYPEWVMKFKEKGTYVNYVKGKYYLYAAHSKRVPGTKKINRVCDGYLGRITEEDGLIPPKDKVSGIVLVLEYGLSSTILAVCSNIHKGFKKTFTKNGDFVMAAAILCFIYGQYSEELFRHSYICMRFPGLDFKMPITDAQSSGIERGARMIHHTMSGYFGDDLQDVILHFGHVYKVRVNKKLYLSEESEPVVLLKQKFNIEWEG
ncbi:MAG TPA: hypothetical protein VFC41_02130 [Anaerovoracaceae bacterium]|nr:hypothetical protein [Anaerovoracaceae bacterium]